MSNTWFTSDLHFFHNNVIAYCNRPYTSVEQMNEMLVKNWNDLVQPQDTVYCLGDFSLALRPVELYTPRLNGYKILIAGNHDWVHPAHKKSKGDRGPQIIQKYKDCGWNEIHTTLELDIDGKKVILCHLPYKGDSTDERYPKYRLEDEGKPVICGHVHQHWKTKITPKGTLMINVGVDVWDMKPVTLETIKSLL